MSWFDPTGIASLAKNALIEAQKKIDKALDIQDDELPAGGGTMSTEVKSSGKMKQSMSNPSMLLHQENNSSSSATSIWGSFSGSFFDNPHANDIIKTVTTPPTPSSNNFPPDMPPPTLLDSRQRTSRKQSSKSLLSESSESVEIVSPPTTPGSGLTSPEQAQGSESVEVLSSPSSSEPLSAMSSSVSELDSLSKNYNPDSVEIISDEIAFDEISIEEEEDDSKSYNTLTEPTTAAAMTIMEGTNTAISSTTTPSRSSLHLALDVSTTSKSITGTNTISELPSDDQQIPKLIAEAAYERSVESFEEQTQLSDSTQSFEYVVNQQTSTHTATDVNRVESPNSSEERSDIVKINSEQTSGHTSADEVETATSSDIEIISSPNGDSSSTNSAYKASVSHCSMMSSNRSDIIVVVGAKKKGHFRESSGHSIQSDDSHLSTQSETERLMRRISELSEVIESREYKLMELGRENAELHERNAEMKMQLEAKRKRDDCLEVTSVTEEYTQRLSALEKKFQQSIRERDNLREQLKQARSELTGKISKEQMESAISEKDFMICELKSEGDKLSKQILQHSNIIKKLRAKEKDTDSTVKRQKDQIDELTEETDRLKKSLSAKEDVERTQIDAVHKLSHEKRKLDKENAQLKSQLDDTMEKLKTIQTSFEVARKEISEKQQSHTELTRKTELLTNLEAEKQQAVAQNQLILTELTQLRDRLRQAENGNSLKEHNLRQENSQILRRLEEAEIKLEEQANAVTESTIPLIRQLESLQSTLNLRTNAWEKQEKILLDKLEHASLRLKKFTDFEQSAHEQQSQFNEKVKTLEEQLFAAQLKSEQTASQLQQKIGEFELQQADLHTELNQLAAAKLEQETLAANYLRQIKELEVELETERDCVKMEKRRFSEYENKPKSSFGITQADELGGGGGGGEAGGSGGGAGLTPAAGRDNSSSPTLSLGHLSQPDSLSSNLWPLEDIDSISNSGRPSYGGGMPTSSSIYAPSTSSIMETLQANLKQRDGENHQLQWEMSRLKADRNVLMTEVSNLTMQLENVKEKIALTDGIDEQYRDLQHKYDALLQMYGEKVEEIQELNLDLQDVKDMYKSQIDELLRQQKLAAKSSS